MSIQHLNIAQLRNLDSVSLQLSPRFNFFIGDNGAGKSSILEAVYLLASGKSFRIADIRKVIRHQQESLSVFVRLTSEDGADRKLGLARDRQGGFEARINGESIRRLADLIRELPVQIISPEAFSLLTSGKKARRSYIDWGVFHVEPTFFHHWQSYQKLLKQRNQLLRTKVTSRSMYAPWNAQFCEIGLLIHEMRHYYVNSLLETMNKVANLFFPEVKWGFKYDAGWNIESDLASALERNFARDLQQGFTSVGPHRATFRLTVNDKAVEQVSSRGQMKLMICCLKLAQGHHLEQRVGMPVTYLIDDIESELDPVRRERVIHWLRTQNKQVFTTAINRSAIAPFVEPDDCVFHVEHGNVRPLQECDSNNV